MYTECCKLFFSFMTATGMFVTHLSTAGRGTHLFCELVRMPCCLASYTVYIYTRRIFPDLTNNKIYIANVIRFQILLLLLFNSYAFF